MFAHWCYKSIHTWKRNVWKKKLKTTECERVKLRIRHQQQQHLVWDTMRFICLNCFSVQLKAIESMKKTFTSHTQTHTHTTCSLTKLFAIWIWGAAIMMHWNVRELYIQQYLFPYFMRKILGFFFHILCCYSFGLDKHGVFNASQRWDRNVDMSTTTTTTTTSDVKKRVFHH